MNNSLPIFLENQIIYKLFIEVINSVPKNSKAYLVGGALRNAVYYSYFKKRLPQRDFDTIFLGDKKLFIKNLREKGFVRRDITRTNQLVFKKKLVKKPKKIEDYFFLDIYFKPRGNIKKLLEEKINFTINGFALSLKDIFKNSWKNKLVHLPNSFEDIKSKKIRLNRDKPQLHGTDLFACIRFMSLGFKEPTKEEVSKLYLALRKIQKYKFERNKNKVFNYVGEARARKLARKIGIKTDIFSFKTIKKLRQLR